MNDAGDNPFEELLLSLARAGVKFIVAGGVAAVFHGVPRVTFALDISVDMDPDNVRRLLDVLEAEGLRPRPPVPAEALLDRESVRKMTEEKGALVFSFVDPRDPLRQVDVFLARDMSYERLTALSESHRLGDQEIRIVSAAGLLQLKSRIHPLREKDELDIRYLRKRLEEKG